MNIEIEKLNKISSSNELSKIFEIVLVNSGIKIKERLDNGIIYAYEETALRSLNLLIYLNTDLLTGGYKEYNNFVASIRNYSSQSEKLDKILIVSSKNISEGFKDKANKEFNNKNIEFWNNEGLITLINKFYPDFWTSSDAFLSSYERYYLNYIKEDYELKSLKIFNDKHKNLKEIFIEPKILLFEKDKESHKPQRKKISKSKIVEDTSSYIISGDAGTGKSTFIKKIGQELIQLNKTSDTNYIPVIITSTNLVDNKLIIINAIRSAVADIFKIFDIDNILQNYRFVLLIDSIDEFNDEEQQKVAQQIDLLNKEKNIRFFIATRNHESLVEVCKFESIKHVSIENFNINQIKSFLQTFFKFDDLKTNKLLDSLKDNKILEKLPITPLTLSLISILYEENQYEIPATITDIYDNFNTFLLGKLYIKNRLHFLDINIKERILSSYALKVINHAQRLPKTISEFELFIKDFFESKSITIDSNLMPEVINYLIKNTGILYLESGKYIKFSHDSFMEYYAAIEIFFHRRSLEDDLVNNFNQVNWQNSAIFYAGKSKDMPDFLEKIITKVQNSQNLSDYFSSISGMGYLLQALYLTDSKLRSRGIKTALELNIKAYEITTTLANEKGTIFSYFPIPHLALMNTHWFYNNFNSITLKDPLSIAFEELNDDFNKYKSFESEEKVNLGYKLYNLAITLASVRINNKEKIEFLFNTTGILNYPLFVLLFDAGLELMVPNSSILQKEVEKSKNKYHKLINLYIKTPASKIKYTQLDSLKSNKKVKIITEGKTDSEIISYAYSVLSTQEPYWTTRSSGNETGGASYVKKNLEAAKALIDKEEIIIGMFDNDSEGIAQFNGLPKEVFKLVNGSKRVKKHIDSEIYAIKLPIPPEKSYYYFERQHDNYFSIEHYFPQSYLLDHKIIKQTSIPNIYEISGNKTAFSAAVRSEISVEVFQDFKYLFDEIDEITGNITEYND